MSRLCVHRDMKHLESLESTQEAGVMHLSCSPNSPRASYLDERTLTHESIVKYQGLFFARTYFERASVSS